MGEEGTSSRGAASSGPRPRRRENIRRHLNRREGEDNGSVKRLLILRHAKSSWSDSSLDDWQRPLSGRGITDAPRVGEMLRDRSLIPDLIVSSDAVRARTTAEAAAKSAGYVGQILLEPSLYGATPDEIIAVLNSLSNESPDTVLVVGHNPGLEGLIHQLSGEHHAMPTAALVELALPIDRWSDLDVSIRAAVDYSWRPKD
jgi:phosphohistidine phosphatase